MIAHFTGSSIRMRVRLVKSIWAKRVDKSLTVCLFVCDDGVTELTRLYSREAAASARLPLLQLTAPFNWEAKSLAGVYSRESRYATTATKMERLVYKSIYRQALSSLIIDASRDDASWIWICMTCKLFTVYPVYTHFPEPDFISYELAWPIFHWHNKICYWSSSS